MKIGVTEMGREKRKRIRLHETTHENDIKYLGPLNYQHFQMLGWLCIVISQAVVMLKLGGRFDKQLAADTKTLVSVLVEIADFSLPFLLIANFAKILNASENYWKQLLKNAGAMAGIALLYVVMLYRYLISGVSAILDEPGQATALIQSLLGSRLDNGFLAFNIFVDLFLCTLVMLFLNYKPKKIFRGKSLHVFRLFALLPIGYEVFCMILKILAAEKAISIPLWFNALMPVKPIMTFVLFLLLAAFVKTRELRFRRHGKTHEEYQAFLKTRRNSRNFSIFLAVMLVVVSVVDIFLMLAYSIGSSVHAITANEKYMAAVDTLRKDAASTEPVLSENEAEEEIITGAPAEKETAGQEGETDSAGQAENGREDVQENPDEALRAQLAEMSDEELEEYVNNELIGAVTKGLETSVAIGIGGSIYLAFLAPVVLLFSYTRKPKNEKISMFIPLAGIAAIIILYLEGARMMMFRLPFQKLSADEVREIVYSLTDTGLKQ